MKYSIVTTTINVPVLLEKYIDDAIKHKRDCFVVVVADKKTPVEAKAYCENLAQQKKIDILFMDIERQEEYLKNFPELAAHIPYNCIMRRNIGILYAYQKGADIIATIDDDNLFLSEDFLGLNRVGDTKELDVFTSQTGWLNVCDFLKEKFGRIFYHRGFPLEERFKEENLTAEKVKTKVVINAGFWMGDPDIDALTRVYYSAKPIESVAFNRTSNFALAKGTWSPFNSQNTSLAREVIPGYFLSPFVGRYDDIWASYVVKHIADHLGHSISFGFPIVDQKRNPHNYWKNLVKEEQMGMMFTPRFVNVLKNIRLSGKDYQTCYREITEALPKALDLDKVVDTDTKQKSFLDNIKNIVRSTYSMFTGSKQSIDRFTAKNDRDYFLGYMKGMNVWVKTFERLNSSQ